MYNLKQKHLVLSTLSKKLDEGVTKDLLTLYNRQFAFQNGLSYYERRMIDKIEPPKTKDPVKTLIMFLDLIGVKRGTLQQIKEKNPIEYEEEELLDLYHYLEALKLPRPN